MQKLKRYNLAFIAASRIAAANSPRARVYCGGGNCDVSSPGAFKSGCSLRNKKKEKMSSSNEDLDTSSVEFTLEDTYEHLKELKSEREHEIQKLMSIVQNNEVKTLGQDVTPEQIRQKRLQFVQSMQKFIAQKQPKDFPIPNTTDFYAYALKELEDEVADMTKLMVIKDKEIKELESDITYMETKLTAFDEMKKALSVEETQGSTNYEAEMAMAKRTFLDVKNDLETTVEELFPDNLEFQELLSDLTKALSKGGDDLYIEIDENVADFANFLEEAGILQFHIHDKTKVKIREF